MAQNRPTWYGWALHTERSATSRWSLSEAAQEGLEHAAELAISANDYQQAFGHDRPLRPLTAREIAESVGVSESTVRRRIATARRELFGQLSDSAIRKRRPRSARACDTPGCLNPIPLSAPANRKYCDQHNTSAARVRRHRARRHLNT